MVGNDGESLQGGSGGFYRKASGSCPLPPVGNHDHLLLVTGTIQEIAKSLPVSPSLLLYSVLQLAHNSGALVDLPEGE